MQLIVPFSLRIVLCLLLLGSPVTFVRADGRPLPKPLADHPGNIFVAGEEIVVSRPGAAARNWRAVDYEGKTVAQGQGGGTVHLGRLPVGYYEVRPAQTEGPKDRLSLGVLAPLAVPTPTTSSIALDVSMAWFFKEDKMPAVTNLCALAGVNWVRDRLNWAEMEPRQGEFAASHTRYDASAITQHEGGLKILQVNHVCPAWAGPAHRRFPTDLRHAYRFYRAMAQRWAGKVLAFEPWNEADIPMFGGHIGSEIASLQKAAYLGLKAGNPRVIACQNVFADHAQAILADFHANQAWPYFDTFNLHHYAAVSQYPNIYADFRAVSAGRPLWVTEFNVPVAWSGDQQRREPADADLRVQAERVAKVYAAALHEGVQAAFYFMLPHYVEHQTQFGLIHPDLTPRPAFVALAAVGRLLADAKPLGKLKAEKRSVHAFLFRARPDGRKQLVLVAWADRGQPRLPLPARPLAAFDHLGRPRAATAGPLELSSSPVYLLFPADLLEKFARDLPPSPAARLGGSPSPVVLQAVWPEQRAASSRSAYRVSAARPERIPIFVYNFGHQPADGKLSVAGPKGWKLGLPGRVSVPPGGRVELALAVDLRTAASPTCQPVAIRGEFSSAGTPVLSLRLLPETP
jgi:hypothetical protein